MFFELINNKISVALRIVIFERLHLKTVFRILKIGILECF